MRVNIDSKALDDPRFARLGARLKMNRHEALGRCVRVWTQAYEARSAIMLAIDVDALADYTGFVKAMIAVDLAQPRRSDKVRLRGVEERLSWLLSQDLKREMAREAKAKKLEARQRADKQATAASTPRSSTTLPGGVPGDVPGMGPNSSCSADPALAPAPGKEQSRAKQEAELALPPRADGWRPPPGGKAEREAERRVAAGELDPRDVDACWRYCVEQGIHREPHAKADARASGAIRKQKRRSWPNGHETATESGDDRPAWVR